MCLSQRDIFESYIYLIARGHILREDKFPGKMLDCLTVHLQADVLSPGHNHCLSGRQIFCPYIFCIARGHFFTGRYFTGNCVPVITAIFRADYIYIYIYMVSGSSLPDM